MRLRQAGMLSLLSGELLVVVTFLLLTLLYHRETLLHDRVLISGDLFTVTYPRYALISEALKEGRLALWNPFIYLGAPLLGDPVNAVLYPGSLLARWFAPPPLVSILVAVHSFLAAWTMYVCARVVLRLGRMGAIGAGITFAFSGVVTGHTNELNFVMAVAWLPLTLTLLSLTLRRQSLGLAGLTAAAVALQFLAGAVQVSYITAVFLVSYGLAHLMRAIAPPLWRVLLLWGREGPTAQLGAHLRALAGRGLPLLFLIAAMGFFAFSFAQPQWQPFRELLSQTTRPLHQSYEEVTAQAVPRHSLLKVLFPAFAEQPTLPVASTAFLALALAFLPLRRRPLWPWTWWLLTMALVGLLLATAFPGLTYLCYTFLPGFAFSESPAAWLVWYGLAIALLCGAGLDLVTRSVEATPSPTPQRELAVGLLLPTFIGGLLYVIAGGRTALPQPAIWQLWIGLAIVMFDLVLLAALLRPSQAVGMGLLLVLGAELVLTTTLPGAQLTALRTLPRALYERALARLPSGSDLSDMDRVLSLPPLNPVQLDADDLALLNRYKLRGHELDDYLRTQTQGLTLTPNLGVWRRISAVDGESEPASLLPTRTYSAWARSLVKTDETVQAFNSAFQPNKPQPVQRATVIPDGPVLGLAAGRYLLAAQQEDVLVNAIAFDLGMELHLPPSTELALSVPSAEPVTSVQLLTYLSGAAEVPTGKEVLEVQLQTLTGTVLVAHLHAGTDTALGAYDHAGDVAHTRPALSLPHRGARNEGYYLTRIPVGIPTRLEKVELRSLLADGNVHIGALTLVDDRYGTVQPLALNPDYIRVQGAHVKMYENRHALPRAYLVHSYEVVPQDSAISRGRDLGRNGVALTTEPAPALPFAGAQDLLLVPDQVTITVSLPERTVLTTRSSIDGLLVLVDAYYPGWKAEVDGSETPILLANGFVRAVFVPAGLHTVTFTYEPQSFRHGLQRLLDALALFVLIMLGLWLARRLTRRAQRTA